MRKQLLCIMLAIFLVMPLISASDWDNIVTYSDELGQDDKVATIYNWLGVGYIFDLVGLGGKIGEAELITRNPESVIAGEDRRVIIYELRDFPEIAFKDLIGKVMIKNLRTNEYENKEYHFEVALYEIKEVPIYSETNCKESYVDGLKMSDVCDKKEIGTKEVKEIVKWIDVEDDYIISGDETFALVTDVNAGDSYDGIWEIAGVELTKHAVWTEGTSIDLKAYYKLDSNVTDSLFSWNLTGVPSPNLFATGIISNGLNVTDIANGVLDENNYSLSLNASGFKEFTFSGWFNFTSRNATGEPIQKTEYLLSTDGSSADFGGFKLGFLQTKTVYFAIHDGSGEVAVSSGVGYFGNSSASMPNFQHIALTINESEFRIYINGTLANVTVMQEFNFTNPQNSNLIKLFGTGSGEKLTNATVDEIGFWNRSLTASEISDLYNSGLGITYTDVFLGTVTTTLDSPADAISSVNSSQIFNCSAIDSGGASNSGVLNMSLWIDGVLEHTIYNTTADQNLSLQHQVNSLALGGHNWTCDAWNIDGVSDMASNRTLAIKTWVENSVSYTGEISAGTTTTFTINVSGSGTDSLTANLSYAGVEYPSNKYGSDKEMRFVNSLAITEPGTNSFFWVIRDDTKYSNSTTKTQNVSAFNMTTCTGTGTVLFNFTIVDEETQLMFDGVVENSSLEIDFNVTTLSGKQVANFTKNVTQINPFAICTGSSLSSSPLRLDGIIRYSARPTYITEFYTLQNFSITNYSFWTNISLYDLKTDDAQEFKVTYKDANFLPVAGAVLDLQRKYIGDGVFRTVEMPKFDSNGITLANFVLGDVIYNLVIKKDGNILATFENVKAYCDNVATGDCEIPLNSFSSSTGIEDFRTIDGVTFTIDYSRDTRTVQSVFTSTSGNTVPMLLNVTLFDVFGNRTICSDSLTASSGTLSCVVPSSYGNATAVGIISKGSSKLGTIFISLWEDRDDIYAGNYVLLALISLTTIIGIGLASSGIVTIFFVIIGAIVNIGLVFMEGGILGAGSAFLWLIIAFIAVIWKASRRQG